MNKHDQKFGAKNLSHYEILGPLGRGSNSFVYKAKCVFTNDVVALKVIDITTEERKEKAKKEVIIHKSLNHEGIVAYIDDFKDDSYWYLVLEYCDKGELYSHLKRRNFALTEEEIKLIGAQLLKTLDYLENQKILHLDIKLGNIFINKSMEVKLGDFGFAESTTGSVKVGKETKISKDAVMAPDSKPFLSTRAKSQSLQKKASKTSLIQGTPSYIAPEMLEQGLRSFKSDIWSFGCVLYALATGKTPFEGRDITHTFNNIIQNSINYPSSLSSAFVDVLKVTFESKPQRRSCAREILEMPFFDGDCCYGENTLSTIVPDADEAREKGASETKPSYLNQIDKQTICDIVKKSHISRNKSSNPDSTEKNFFMVKSIKSKRLINEMLTKQSALASTLQAKYVIGKLDNVGRKCVQRNLY